MNKVFIVIGPESSGTRAVTKLFCLAGCFGDDTHNQYLDNIFGKDIDLPDSHLVFRRSIPHENSYPDFPKLDRLFYSKGYESRWVICIRDYMPLWKSKINQKRKGSERDAKESIADEYKYIFEQLSGLCRPFYLLPTSLLFLEPKRVLVGLSDWSGLRFPLDEVKKQVWDADGKWFV